jgi:membrane fusion protein (multidrug efflux system)
VAEPQKIFRKEAIEALEAGLSSEGDVLRISPVWVHWTYWAMAAMLLVALVYGAVGTVSEYASGPALIRVEGRTDVTTPLGGTVVGVLVRPGQRIKKGQLLARFYGGQETVELERLKREFELELARVLRDPNDQAARQSLTTLRAQKEQAEAHLAERSVRAPQDGIVNDVRIRSGQLLQPGELVCSLIGDKARFYIDALLPGQYRPMLHKGLSMRLEITGFQYSYQDLAIESVGDEVVGPAEVRRYLGPEIGDSLPVAGPVVLVRARLPSRDFSSENRRFSYYSGIPARADVRVRTETILLTLIPALKAVFKGGRG